jgi:hypothetical protein
VSRCDSGSCFCAFPPVRRIASTGQKYTVEELPASGSVRVFRYLYLVDNA